MSMTATGLNLKAAVPLRLRTAEEFLRGCEINRSSGAANVVCVSQVQARDAEVMTAAAALVRSFLPQSKRHRLPQPGELKLAEAVVKLEAQAQALRAGKYKTD